MAKAQTTQQATTQEDDNSKRRNIKLRQFLPTQEIITKELTGKPKGTRLLVGRIYGLAFDAVEKLTVGDDGEPKSNTAIVGVFSCSSVYTKAGGEATTVYFTPDFAKHIHDIVVDQKDGDGKVTQKGVGVMELDCDIMLETTDKGRLAFKIIQHVEGDAQFPLKRLASARSDKK